MFEKHSSGMSAEKEADRFRQVVAANEVPGS